MEEMTKVAVDAMGGDYAQLAQPCGSCKRKGK